MTKETNEQKKDFETALLSKPINEIQYELFSKQSFANILRNKRFSLVFTGFMTLRMVDFLNRNASYTNINITM